MIHHSITCDVCATSVQMEHPHSPPEGWTRLCSEGTLTIEEAAKLGEREQAQSNAAIEARKAELAEQIGVSASAIDGIVGAGSLFTGQVLPRGQAPRSFSFDVDVCPKCFGTPEMLQVIRAGRAEGKEGGHQPHGGNW